MALFSWLSRWFGHKQRKHVDSEQIARRMAAIRSARSDMAVASTPAGQTPSAVSTEILRSAIRKGFNSTQPVSQSAQLHGRHEQLELLTEGVLDRGNHALIYGARGSGKTSLARVFANIADNRGNFVLYSACEPDQNFGELMRPYAEAMAGGKVDLPTDRPVNPRDMTEVMAQHGRRRFILLMDEFDRVTDSAVQHDVARLMKMLSDAAIPVHIVAVGIASGLENMIEGHASLRRHMSVIPVARIEPQAVFDIIARGADAIGMTFTDASRETIAHLSCGSPYHVRLFCALACFEVIKRQRKTVDLPATLAGVARAVNDWALTNAEDAALFRKIIAMNVQHWPQLEAIARMAAAQGEFSPARLKMDDALSDRLLVQFHDALTVEEQEDRIAFRDSLAPQFLLAMLFAAQNSGKIDENIISMNELHRQSVAQQG
jgi:MoxR-like ATPase